MLLFLAEPVTRAFFEVSGLPHEEAPPRVTWESVFGQQRLSGEGMALPPDFEAEVLSCASFPDRAVSPSGRVVGLFGEGMVSDTFERCSRELQAKGWVKVESGYVHAASFIKQDGRYTGLFLSCASIGEGTSVLVQLFEGEGDI